MVARLLLVFLFASMAPVARAQFEPAVPETVVTWTARVRPPATARQETNTFRPGEQLFVTLTADVVDGWRLYALDSPGGLPLELHLDAPPSGLVVDGTPGEDEPLEGFDVALGEGYRYHTGRARVWQAYRVGRTATPGVRVIAGHVRFAACNDEICLPPREVPFQARLVVVD